jgi:hypothetical protein
MFRTTTLAAAILSLGLISGLRAETKPELKDGNPPATKTESIPAAPGVLTDAKLKEMLETLGYEPREEKIKDGMNYQVFITVDGLKYDVTVQISPNKEKIWTTIPLADMNDEHLKMASRWVKLTQLNDEIGPCYFRYNLQYKRLYMTRPMDNRGVTAKLLRDHLERHTDRCAETKLHWMSANWTVKPQSDVGSAK